MREWKKRLFIKSLAATLATASLAAGALAETVTLGAAVPLTGNLGITGRYYRDAYQFAVDKINEKGGVMVGGKTYEVALKIVDSKSEVKLAVRQYERLLTKEKVNFLLGPYSSRHVLESSSVAEKFRVPMVQSGGATSRIFSRGYKYVFGMLPVADDYFRSTIEMLPQLTPKARTVAMISGSGTFDRASVEGTVATLKKAGFALVLNQEYSDSIPNFYNILTMVEYKAPDVILWSGHEAGAIRFIREAKSRNINAKLLASFTVGVPSANFRAALGKDANYAFGVTPWLPSDGLKDKWFGDASQFARAYEEKYGYMPDYHAAAAVATIETFIKAIEAAGTLNPSQVRDAIATLDFESVYTRIRFGKNGQIVLPQIVIQIKDNKVVEIFTDRLINQPVYPVPAWNKRP